MELPIQKIVVKREIKGPYRDAIYREFILWTAMPYEERVNLGIESQKEFTEYYKIGVNACTTWKHRKDFEDRVDEIVKVWSNEKTPAVIHSIYRGAIKGNPMSQMLWLQYFKKFNPKQQQQEEEKKVVLGVNDIRYAIEQLPEPMKTECYGYLRTIAENLVSYKNSRDITDDNWDEQPTQSISDEANNDAQDVRYIEQPNAMAESDTPGVRRDMVRTVPKSHNQSTERWWQE